MCVLAKNNELRVLRERLAQASTDNDKKEHEASVQIKQLKKLVDHLQSKVDSQSASHGSSKTTKKQIMSNKLAMSYEEVTSQLEREKLKVRQMQEELLKRKKSSASANNENVGAPESNKASAAAKPLKEKAAKDLASKNPVAETGHAIPHRFQKQTTMKVQKCSVCFGHILFCSSMCVCKFCHRVVHPSCEVNVGQDCGLSSGLALMLKTNASNSQGRI